MLNVFDSNVFCNYVILLHLETVEYSYLPNFRGVRSEKTSDFQKFELRFRNSNQYNANLTNDCQDNS